MSLEYVIKEVSDGNYLLHIDKNQIFLQVDISTLYIKVSYRVILSLLISMIKHFQNT